MTTIPCYLRTLRRERGMTQEELARLVEASGYQRVSYVERGLASPNAREILAYCVLFGLAPAAIFPALYDEVEESLIASAYELDEELERDSSQRATQIRELLHAALARATGKARNPMRV
jgi:transcriptional regulator with XRE-family HTH domain